jgi:hypothetical protein
MNHFHEAVAPSAIGRFVQILTAVRPVSQLIRGRSQGRSAGEDPGGSTVRSKVLTLHLAAVAQMVNSVSGTPTLRSQLVFVGRLGQLTLVAYLKLLRVVIAERLWSVDDIPPPKETSP